MLRLSNLRIGTKLAVMSGLGVLLVAAMLATQMLGNASVRNSNDRRRSPEPALMQNALDANASIRGMQIGVRDLRLAHSVDDMIEGEGLPNDSA